MNRWLPHAPLASSCALRLFCFPYGGGSSVIFRRFQEALPEDVQVCAVELPGRGRRFSEPPFSELPRLTDAALSALSPYFDRPFALFGHSMGALIAFELARGVLARGVAGPEHLFLSAYAAPSVVRPRIFDDALSDDAVLELLRAHGGTDESFFRNEELRRALMPVLRADLSLLEGHEYAGMPPLACDITAFGGAEDDGTTKRDLLPWRKETLGAFRLHLVPGDHFFINSDPSPMLAIVARTLRAVLRRTQHGRAATDEPKG